MRRTAHPGRESRGPPRERNHFRQSLPVDSAEGRARPRAGAPFSAPRAATRRGTLIFGWQRVHSHGHEWRAWTGDPHPSWAMIARRVGDHGGAMHPVKWALFFLYQGNIQVQFIRYLQLGAGRVGHTGWTGRASSPSRREAAVVAVAEAPSRLLATATAATVASSSTEYERAPSPPWGGGGKATRGPPASVVRGAAGDSGTCRGRLSPGHLRHRPPLPRGHSPREGAVRTPSWLSTGGGGGSGRGMDATGGRKEGDPTGCPRTGTPTPPPNHRGGETAVGAPRPWGGRQKK